MGSSIWMFKCSRGQGLRWVGDSGWFQTGGQFWKYQLQPWLKDVSMWVVWRELRTKVWVWFPRQGNTFFYKVPFLWPVPEAKHVLPGHCWTQGHSRFEDCLWVAVCLATRPEAQTRVFHRPIFPTRATQLRQCIKAGQCLQKATLLPETEDTLSSTLRFVASQKLCQRSVGLISWLGKLVPGPREQGSSRLTDGGGVGAWDALRRRQVSADSLCVKTWVAQFRRDKRDFKEGQDDLRVWLNPRKESGICYFSSSFLLEAKGCSSSSNYARNVGKNLLEGAE